MSLRSILAICLFAFAVVTPAAADSFPTYSYFYSCDSGVVDCSTFHSHYYGDFGMANPPVVIGLPSYIGIASVIASNVLGEVIEDVRESTGSEEGYGVGGHVYDLDCCDANVISGDINNEGVYVFGPVNGGGFGLSIGSDGTRRLASVDPGNMPTGFLGSISYTTVDAINESDQVLVDLLIGDPLTGSRTEERGVFSPFAVPEPSSLCLLLTILLGSAWIARQRFAE